MKKIAVLGGGISGYGSAILAKKKGFDVFLSDMGKIADRYKAKLDEWQVPYEEGGHTEERILAAHEVVKSPGIPETVPIVRKIRAAGIPVISEMEFAGRYLGRSKCICITGSNGKTTTTSLIYKIMRDAGMNAALGGNIGESFAYSVATGNYDWYVLELSSFQLDGMYKFRAHIGVLMNITPDHLDRYGHCFQNYVDSKMRITQNQNSRDYFVYSGDDEVIWQQLPRYDLRMKQLPFAAKNAVAVPATPSCATANSRRPSGRPRSRSTRPRCSSKGCTMPITPWPRLLQPLRQASRRPRSAARSTASPPSATVSNPSGKAAAYCGSTTPKPPMSTRYTMRSKA